MISDHSIVESRPGQDRCQVVHWLRTFPFSFISQREYVIARRVWRQDGALYGIMKSVTHPQAPAVSGIVRMDVFYSMWRSRTVPNPRDPSRPACETVLLHHEQFKIPENLARFAVRHGMAGFVKKMAPAVVAFVAARRERVDAVTSSTQYCCVTDWVIRQSATFSSEHGMFEQVVPTCYCLFVVRPQPFTSQLG